MMFGFTRFRNPGRRMRPGQLKAGRVRQTRPSMTAPSQLYHYREKTMWTKPEFTEMRFGFEVTMYIANR
jgi:coenzyme PQQ precursor peptide PqqA